MPRTEINYQNTVIYKIQHIEKNDLLYVGHTTDFVKRKCQHKSSCNNENSKQHYYKVYTLIRENGGWDMFKMLEIKKFQCIDKREAEAEEDRLMKEMKVNMNSNNAIYDIQKQRDYGMKYNITHKEDKQLYYETNKEHFEEYKRQWYLKNKERHDKKCKENYEVNKVKNKEKMKEKRLEY